MNEGEFRVTKGWEDKTVTGLSFPVGSKQPTATFAVTRDAQGGAGRTLQQYVDRQMIELAKACARFDLVEREEATVDGEPAQRVTFSWRTPDGIVVQQQQTIVKLATGVMLTFTATAPRNKFKDHAARFHSFVESFRFRAEEDEEE